MKVIGRDGSERPVSFDAIKERIVRLMTDHGLDSIMDTVDVDRIVIQTISGMYDGISTSELDDLSARICATMQSVHFDYDTVAACIAMSDKAKRVRHLMESRGYASQSFSSKMAFLEECGGVKLGASFARFVKTHADALDAMIVPARDIQRHGYFAFRTMERSYLLRSFDDDIVIESPQDMWMRVAICVNDVGDDGEALLPRIRECYDDMSLGRYTHATPTLFNAGTAHPQCSSCYLLGTEDSMDGIWTTIKNAAMISKWAGGIGVHVSNVRAKGARIHSTNGLSDGIVPMLRCYNDMVRYCNQAGRRKGSIAVYLEPWHADTWDFCELRRNTGSETERARDIFLALWVPDEFMLRVEADAPWFFMSPDTSPGLVDAVGEDFSALYNSYVDAGKYLKSVPARKLWQHIITCQLETGTPFIMYKDHVNRKCNQKNVGTIRSSNLCAEITEFSSSESYAVCNLASIAVPSFVLRDADGAAVGVDHPALHECAKRITYNLNNVIDTSMYPVPETRGSNMQLRPIGIGVQGLGDLYCMLSVVYDDERAVRLDAEIMETIYHGAIEASVELAAVHGPYEHFHSSPISEGLFQFDLWNQHHDKATELSGRYDWDAMREDIRRHGVRNSMLTALMPTASTSQILGNSECFEPIQSNIFKRSTLAGEFLVVNRHLMRTLIDMGLWTPDLRARLMASDGSVQGLEDVPEHVRLLYRTVWEIPQRSIIDHAAARGPFVCQSQSMNIFMTQPSFSKLSSALMHGWRLGLKTGMYYLRTRAAVEATRVGAAAARQPSATASAAAPTEGTNTDAGPDRDANAKKKEGGGGGGAYECTDEVCVMCSS
jgi:ribonucleoside-diphosphate reductase alpha chain